MILETFDSTLDLLEDADVLQFLILLSSLSRLHNHFRLDRIAFEQFQVRLVELLREPQVVSQLDRVLLPVVHVDLHQVVVLFD